MKKIEDKNTEILRIKDAIMKVLNENDFRDVKIILFGSRAKDVFKAHSDWDFLVILKEQLQLKERWYLAHKIRKVLAEIYIPCDVIIRSEDEVKKRENVIGSVIRSAIKTGVTI